MRINNVHCFNCGKIAAWICDICRNVICYDCINLVAAQEVCDACRSVAIDSTEAAIQDRISKAVTQALDDAVGRVKHKMGAHIMNIDEIFKSYLFDAVRGVSSDNRKFSNEQIERFDLEPRSDQINE